MTITLTERFLSITMNYEGKSGYKGYGNTTGHTHTIEVYNITDTKQLKKMGMSSYSQTVTPMSVIQGKQPDTIKIEGKLCSLSEVPSYLAPLAAYRSRNTLFNVFLPCSILTVASSVAPEANGTWIVYTFKIKRNLQKRSIIAFELVLYRWYGE